MSDVEECFFDTQEHRGSIESSSEKAWTTTRGRASPTDQWCPMQRRDQCFDRTVSVTRWSLKKKINGA